jgi:N-acetylglucosaminyldiphosphoundecaprenol N-acetyl-beta-D-mannosaminyltransferase
MTVSDRGRPFVHFLDLRFDQLNEYAAPAAVMALSRQDRFAYVVTPNVDHVVRLHGSRGNAELWSSYSAATLSLCDSRILMLLARVAGIKLPLATGSDLTTRLLDSPDRPSRIGVVGGDDVLMQELAALFPQTQWYHHAPPFGLLGNPPAQLEVIEFVEACPASLIFFAIGSPQSELICAQIARRGGARGVALCVGASLEFVTGAKPRAPKTMQKAGLEWLFRLTTEPRRLWRRYLVEGPAIFLIWLRWLIRGPR